MKEFKYVITDEVGIHARPAGNLSKLCKGFSSKVTISANGQSAEATKLMAVMNLGAKKETEITISVEGDDEEKAAAEVEAFLKENL